MNIQKNAPRRREPPVCGPGKPTAGACDTGAAAWRRSTAASRSGELIHIDVKKLGRIERIGHRITGNRHHRPVAGWEYLHVCIDDASRLAYGEMLPDERKKSCCSSNGRWIGLPASASVSNA